VPPGADGTLAGLDFRNPQALDKRNRAAQRGYRVAFRNLPVTRPHLGMSGTARDERRDAILEDGVAHRRRERRLDMGEGRGKRRPAGRPHLLGSPPAAGKILFDAAASQGRRSYLIGYNCLR
jgi:hypothetical protein